VPTVFQPAFKMFYYILRYYILLPDMKYKAENIVVVNISLLYVIYTEQNKLGIISIAYCQMKHHQC